MSESKEKPVVKQLPCGGYAIFTIDNKTKQLVQTGYVGSKLESSAYLPTGSSIQK